MKRIIYLLLTASSFSFAQATSDINEEWEQHADVYTECAAYYSFLITVLDGTGFVTMVLNGIEGSEVAASYYKSLADEATAFSIVLASAGRDHLSTYEHTKSRVKHYARQIKYETSNSDDEIVVLVNTLGDSCSALQGSRPEVLNEAFLQYNQ